MAVSQTWIGRKQRSSTKMARRSKRMKKTKFLKTMWALNWSRNKRLLAQWNAHYIRDDDDAVDFPQANRLTVHILAAVGRTGPRWTLGP
jgi:hypothetical protein